MSCKSAIFVSNTGAQTVALGGTIDLGSIIRRFGCAVNLNGNGITLGASGYYKTDVSVTAAPTAAGVVTVSLYLDGVAVPGATASATAAAAGDSVVLAFPALVRLVGQNTGGALTLVLSGEASTVENVAVVVEKI